MTALAPSRYNFAVCDAAGEIAVFNASAGGVIKLGGDHAHTLGTRLLEIGARFSGEEFDPDLLGQLLRGGFLVAEDADELQIVRERYWRARGETPVVLTITTTMDCNLGCYYCYEERSADRLETADVAAIIELAKSRLARSPVRALHVDWYGGEPLLNLEFLEAASAALQDYCKAERIHYAASIISNGSLWPDDVEGFIARNRIGQVQISFDGLKAHHDKRRRYRKGHAGESSFLRAAALVDRLVGCVRVDLRFNIDRGNSADLLPFLAFARDRGWFAGPFPAVFQPARLASYSSASGFMRSHELTLEEFDALRTDVRNAAGGDARVEESEIPDGFPFPKTSVCAALANNSVVVGAEGGTYRCGLQVGERARAVGALGKADAGADAPWWDAFDPTTAPTCSRCSFLPICWGGCPKKHLEGDRHAIDEQGRYWRNNLPRLIAQAGGLGPIENDTVPERLQFR